MTFMVDRFLAKVQSGFEKVLRVLCPPLHVAIYSRYGEWERAKFVMGLLWGLVLGFVLHVAVLTNLRMPRSTELILYAFLSAILAIGNACSIQIRCICLLAIPTFFGKAGRNALRALLVSLVIAGPVRNIMTNGREAIRLFTCSTTMALDLLKARFQLMVSPLRRALIKSKNNLEDVKEDLRFVHDMVGPIVGEIEGPDVMKAMIEDNDYMDIMEKKKVDEDEKKNVDEEKRQKLKDRKAMQPEVVEKEYKGKMSGRCFAQLQKGIDRCRKMFESAYNKCYDTVTFLAAWLLCWPMKLNFVCNLIMKLGGGKACNVLDKIDPGFGEGYISLKQADNIFGQNFKQVRLQVEVPKPQFVDSIKDAATNAKELENEIRAKKDMIDQIIYILLVFFSLFFIKIIIQSQSYHDAYLTKIYHDNLYVTRYFRKIDARRRAGGKLTLLPLRKYEKKTLIDPFSLTLTEMEKTYFRANIVAVLLQAILATTLLLLDRIIVEVLNIVSKHSRMEITQEGEHELELEVIGTGMLAKIVRTILKGFQLKDHVMQKVDNEKCLPRAHALTAATHLEIYGCFLGLIALLFTQSYLLRLRRFVCSYFYPKREKRRVLRLYNDRLRKRMSFMGRARKEVLATAKRLLLMPKSKLSLKSLMKGNPKKFGWLRVFKAARDQCVMCGVYEAILEKNRIKEPFIISMVSYCPLVYCGSCWYDIGEACFVCDPHSDDDEGDENSDDDYRKEDSENEDTEDD